MLTKVILEGPMGKELGREWAFAINTPSEALQMLQANGVEVYRWIRSNLKKYERYQVICEYEDGQSEALTKDEYSLGFVKRCTLIRFVPLIDGAGDAARVIVGIVLIVVGYFFMGTDGGSLIAMGVSLVVGGVVGMLTPKPSRQSASESKDADNKASFYFDGATNTTGQGNPVQLIYGRVRVGSHTIAVSNTVDQLM